MREYSLVDNTGEAVLTVYNVPDDVHANSVRAALRQSDAGIDEYRLLPRTMLAAAVRRAAKEARIDWAELQEHCFGAAPVTVRLDWHERQMLLAAARAADKSLQQWSYQVLIDAAESQLRNKEGR